MSGSSLSVGRALMLWVIYVLTFVLFGGLGAGVTAFVFEQLLGQSFTDVLYAVSFGVIGFIAYRLAREVAG